MDRLKRAVETAGPAAASLAISRFARDGDAIVAAVRPASHEAGESYQSRIWRFGLDGSARGS